MAVTWLDNVIHTDNNWVERWRIVLTSSTDYFPMDCIEIALDTNLYEFLSHPLVMRFVDHSWIGTARQLIEYKFSVPDVFKIMEYAEENR